MATKSTKKDLLNKMEERLLRNVAEMMEQFRNSVNEATETNMTRILTSLHASASVIDSQTDRLNALAQMILDNGVCSEEQLQKAIVSQKAARIEASKQHLEAMKAKEEEAKKEVEEEATLSEEAVVLGAAEENIPFTQPTGNHPAEADIFGG